MSHDSKVTRTYDRDGQSVETSRNLGRDQANSGGTLSGQQSGESHISFETRQNEYNWIRSQQDKKSS